MIAAYNGHLEIIDELITHNADYNAKCAYGKIAKDHAKTEDVSQHIQ